MFRNKILHFSVILLTAGIALSGVLQAADSILIDGTTRVQVIAAPGNDQAVRFLKDFLSRAVPAAQVTVAAQPEPGALQIHLGPTDRAAKLALPAMADDEFIIDFPDPATIVIAGGSEFGTMYGTAEFLERFAGVRWLFPGPLGLHIPRHEQIAVPMEKIASRPVFISRELSWAYPFEERANPDYLGWRRFHRMRGTIAFHHNLDKLFPPAKYRESHPQFYPIIGGRRVTPEDDKTKWNPLLNAPGITEEAVKSICEYFAAHPSATSYSLGMNDIAEFDDARATRKNSVGNPDYSDYYYTWMNNVIAGVTAQYPGKWFGTLAYMSVTDPPNFDLNPRAVPFICVDRMNWYDAQRAEIDRERTRNWGRAASTLGWYDYVYGDNRYLVPRIYNHLMAETIRFAAAHGVRAYYAEIYNSKFHREGPKAYLLMKLLWNPDLDEDALLDEWYRCAVGEKAAPELKKYFDFWEDYWRNEVPKTDWFANGKTRVYFDFDDKGYMARLKPEDVKQCEAYLQAAVAKAGTAAEIARAKFFLEGFQQLKGQIQYALAFYAKPASDRLKLISGSDYSTMIAAPRSAMTKFPLSWNAWQRSPGKAQPRWDQSVGCANAGSLAVNMAGSTGGPFCFMRSFNVQSGRNYMVRLKIRNEGLEKRSEIFVKLGWLSEGKRYPLYDVSKKLSPRNEGQWQTLEINFTPPQQEVLKDPSLSLELYVYKATRGQVWFDDVELFEVLAAQ